MQRSRDGVILNTEARPSYRRRELGSGASGSVSEITSADWAGGAAGTGFISEESRKLQRQKQCNDLNSVVCGEHAFTFLVLTTDLPSDEKESLIFVSQIDEVQLKLSLFKLMLHADEPLT